MYLSINFRYCPTVSMPTRGLKNSTRWWVVRSHRMNNSGASLTRDDSWFVHDYLKPYNGENSMAQKRIVEVIEAMTCSMQVFCPKFIRTFWGSLQGLNRTHLRLHTCFFNCLYLIWLVYQPCQINRKRGMLTTPNAFKHNLINSGI